MAAPIMIAGTALTLIGQLGQNYAEAQREKQNAKFYQEQAEYARAAEARASAIAAFDYTYKLGLQEGAFASGGVDTGSGSAALTLGGTIKQAIDELFAIKQKGDIEYQLANMRGVQAGENAALLSSAGYNFMQGLTTATNNYTRSEGFGTWDKASSSGSAPTISTPKTSTYSLVRDI